MAPMIIAWVMLIAVGASIMTMMGGTLALTLRDKLGFTLGFSAGAVTAFVFFRSIARSRQVKQPFGVADHSLRISPLHDV